MAQRAMLRSNGRVSLPRSDRVCDLQDFQPTQDLVQRAFVWQATLLRWLGADASMRCHAPHEIGGLLRALDDRDHLLEARARVDDELIALAFVQAVAAHGDLVDRVARQDAVDLGCLAPSQ